MFVVTSEARAIQAAEAEKRRKREQGRTPAHAMAEGHQEAVDEQRDVAKDRHDIRHPRTGQYTATSAWPGTEAHMGAVDGVRRLQVGDPRAPAPTPQAVLSDRFSGDHAERYMHPGSAAVQHLGLANAFPLPVATVPLQPAFRTAPTGSAQ